MAKATTVTSVTGRLPQHLIDSTSQGVRNAQDHLDLWDETQKALGNDLSSITTVNSLITALTARIIALEKKAGI